MLLVLAIAVILIFWLANMGNTGKTINFTQLSNMIENNEITDIYLQGNTGYARRKDSKITDKAWPKDADYNFDISYNAQTSVIFEYNEKIRLANEGTTEEQEQYAKYKDRTQIVIQTKTPSAPLIQTIMPYLSILVVIVIAVLMFRMFSSKNGGANNFGKSRARITEKSTVKFDDIAGADEEKAETAEIVEFLKNPTKFKNLGARIPKGVLLVGSPGTGKTLLAKAVAGESNVPFFSISGSDFVELYVGVGASRVRDLFDTAKRSAPCIVFIDEIDAVGRQRGAGMGGGNDEREQTLNQLLVEMDGFESFEGIIVLAATNRADVLDPALLRPGRFDRQIYVNVPDVRGREGIMKIHAKNKPIDEDVDFKAIARLTSGFTGADIENFLNEAAILAARDSRVTISMEDITEGINKVLMGPQKKSRVVTEEDKKLTAYHESGHAIVAKLLKSGDNVHEVSIIPRGMAGGYTQTRPDDDNENMSYEKLSNKICMIMGGRAAEEIIFNDITAGASSDINQATKIARKMITEWGMSKKLGFINFGSSAEVFIGRDYQTQNNYSEATAALIDQEIKALLDKCYLKTVDILKKNKKTLDNMAKLLLEKDTIYTDEVEMIINGSTWKEVVAVVDKKEKVKREKSEEKRKIAEVENARKMQELKLQAAEALKNAGVISKQELELIKNESKRLEDKVKEHEVLKAQAKIDALPEETKPTFDAPEKVSISAKNEEKTNKEIKASVSKTEKTNTEQKKEHAQTSSATKSQKPKTATAQKPKSTATKTANTPKQTGKTNSNKTVASNQETKKIETEVKVDQDADKKESSKTDENKTE